MSLQNVFQHVRRRSLKLLHMWARPNFRFLWRRDGKICPNLCMSSGPICISCTGDRYCPYIHLICMVVLSDILDSGGVAWWSRRKGSCHRKVLPRVRSPSNVYRWNQSLWASNVTWWFVVSDHLFPSLFLQHCTSKLVSLGIPVTLPGGVFRPNRIFKDFQEVNLKTKRNKVKAFQLASMCIFFSCGFSHLWSLGIFGSMVKALGSFCQGQTWKDSATQLNLVVDSWAKERFVIPRCQPSWCWLERAPNSQNLIDVLDVPVATLAMISP